MKIWQYTRISIITFAIECARSVHVQTFMLFLQLPEDECTVGG